MLIFLLDESVVIGLLIAVVNQLKLLPDKITECSDFQRLVRLCLCQAELQQL